MTMKTADAIAFFGSRYRIAMLLGVRPPAVYRWKEFVPPLRQLQLERISRGELTADPALKIRPPRRRPQRRSPAPQEPVLVTADDDAGSGHA